MPLSRATPLPPLARPRARLARLSGRRRAPAWLELAAGLAAVSLAVLLAARRGDAEPAPPFGQAEAARPWPTAERLAFVGDCNASGRDPSFCLCLANAYQLRWPSYAGAIPAVLAAGDSSEARERCREYAQAREAWLARRR